MANNINYNNYNHYCYIIIVSIIVKPLLSGHLQDLPKCPLNRGFIVKYYSHCYYKMWQYYAKYAYHADKLSHSHSCLLERELPLMQIVGGGGACPHLPSLSSPQLCISTQNWSIGNVIVKPDQAFPSLTN